MESLDDELKKLKVDAGDVNILLLGETGVGKSTFINAIANYLTYSTDFEKLEKKPDQLSVLIPMIINIKDKNKRGRKIPIGKTDQNEVLKVGESATQDVKTYVFPIWKYQAKVRIIDTPGMGDTRGINQDHINSENILSYISQLDELHAICFLFRPDNARSTVFFQYCIAQIFSRLDKSASDNIIFVFTGTRGANYGPGDTMQVLRKTINDIRKRPPHVHIPLERNIFCFENESFKYLATLAAVGQEVNYSKEDREKFKESWRKSSSEIWRLINYIVGDYRNKPLVPHLVKSTTAVNEARRVITHLAKPLADVSELINDNMNVLQRHEDNLRLDCTSLDELKKQLFMPVINLKTIKQTQPCTVCVSRSCAEIYKRRQHHQMQSRPKVGDNNKWHYKQRCHDPCYLKNVRKEHIGSPELTGCAAMNGTKTCQKCDCDFSIHMHIYYMTKTVEEVIKDDNIEKNITSKEKILEERKNLIKKIRSKKEELDNEQKIIVKTCAKFAHFLENNAITPFSDSYKEYIEYLITREKSLGDLCNQHTLNHLQRLLFEYREAKKFFEEAKSASGKSDVSPLDVSQGVQDLYGLKINGQKIKELFECQTTSRKKEYKNSEYVHKGTSERTGKKKDKEGKENRGSGKEDGKKTRGSDKEGSQNRWKDRKSNQGRSNNSRGSGREENQRQKTENQKPYQQRTNYRQPPNDLFNQLPPSAPQYPPYQNSSPHIPPLMGPSSHMRQPQIEVSKRSYEGGQHHGDPAQFDIGIRSSGQSDQQYSAGNSYDSSQANSSQHYNDNFHHPQYNSQPNSSQYNYNDNYQHPQYPPYNNTPFDPNMPLPPHGSYQQLGYDAYHIPRYDNSGYYGPYNNYPPQGYPHAQHFDHPVNRHGANRHYGNDRGRPGNRNNNYRGGRGRRGGVNENYRSENQKKKEETESESESESESDSSSSSDSSDS